MRENDTDDCDSCDIDWESTIVDRVIEILGTKPNREKYTEMTTAVQKILCDMAGV